MKKEHFFKIATWLLALMMIVFGANKFLGFANVPPPADETAQLFMGAMFGSYLAKFVGLIEIIGGILILIPRTAFIGLLLLLPIIANIVAFHFAHDLPGNGIWLFTLLVTILVVLDQKDRFYSLINYTGTAATE